MEASHRLMHVLFNEGAVARHINKYPKNVCDSTRRLGICFLAVTSVPLNFKVGLGKFQRAASSHFTPKNRAKKNV